MKLWHGLGLLFVAAVFAGGLLAGVVLADAGGSATAARPQPPHLIKAFQDEPFGAGEVKSSAAFDVKECTAYKVLASSSTGSGLETTLIGSVEGEEYPIRLLLGGDGQVHFGPAAQLRVLASSSIAQTVTVRVYCA